MHKITKTVHNYLQTNLLLKKKVQVLQTKKSKEIVWIKIERYGRTELPENPHATIFENPEIIRPKRSPFTVDAVSSSPITRINLTLKVVLPVETCSSKTISSVLMIVLFMRNESLEELVIITDT